MQTIIRSLRTLLAALTLAALPACAAEHGIPAEQSFPVDDGTEAALTVDEVTDIARVALDALNEGDYDGWTAGWTAEMRDAIGPDAFAEFRANVLENAGRFVEILDASLTDGNDPGNVRFTFLCAFEKGEWIFVLAFREDGTEAVGVEFSAVAE